MDRTLLELTDLLHRQHGVVSRDTMLAAGLTTDQVDHRIHLGVLVPTAPRVFRVASSPDTPLARLWAAHLSLPDSVVSHRSSVWIQGYWSSAPTPELSIPYSHRGAPPGAIVHRRRPDMLRRSVVVDGLRVTRIEIAILECAGVLSDLAFRYLVDDFVGGRRERIERLADWFRLVCGQGIAGTVRARRELERRVDGDVAESRLERLFLEVVDRAGLPRPTLQWIPPWNPGIRVDGAYVDKRVIVELDSRRFHADPTSFEADRRRDLEAAAHGWRTVRITWAQLRHEPAQVVRLLRSVLAAEL